MLFNKKKQEQEAIKAILDYVEGKENANFFRNEFLSNKNLQNALKQKLSTKSMYLSEYNCNIFDFLSGYYDFSFENWDTVSIRNSLYYYLTYWLDYNQIEYEKFTKYKEDYELLLDFLPSWLDIADDQGIFDRLLAEVPKDLSKTKQIAWGKARLKELFRYDKTYPRWIQSPEWPIVDGKPLVFSHQKKLAKDDIRVHYYFYDPDTKEEVVIEQFE